MIVVSDSSVVSNLLRLGAEGLLFDLFQEVVIPAAVEAELRRFHASLPARIVVRAPVGQAEVQRLLKELDAGEAEAIVLAQELHANWVLMDEKLGRQIARREGVRPLGLGGVLLQAKARGLIAEIRSYLNRLEKEAGFYLSDDVKRELLNRAGESVS
jgi:predicted nucleic acid-binding protein